FICSAERSSRFFEDGCLKSAVTDVDQIAMEERDILHLSNVRAIINRETIVTLQFVFVFPADAQEPLRHARRSVGNWVIAWWRGGGIVNRLGAGIPRDQREQLPLLQVDAVDRSSRWIQTLF